RGLGFGPDGGLGPEALAPLSGGWEDEAEAGAPARLALHLDDAVVLLHDAVGDGQPHARAALALRREQGLEDPRPYARAHPDAGVLDLGDRPACGVGEGAEAEEPAGRHRLHRVEDEVDEDLAQLRRPPLDR